MINIPPGNYMTWTSPLQSCIVCRSILLDVFCFPRCVFFLVLATFWNLYRPLSWSNPFCTWKCFLFFSNEAESNSPACTVAAFKAEKLILAAFVSACCVRVALSERCAASINYKSYKILFCWSVASLLTAYCIFSEQHGLLSVPSAQKDAARGERFDDANWLFCQPARRCAWTCWKNMRTDSLLKCSALTMG